MRGTAERRATRMHRMMARLDVDVLVLVRMRDGDAYAEARARCVICAHADECLRWLDRGGEGNGEPGFCANLDVFNTCRSFTSEPTVAPRHPKRLRCRPKKERSVRASSSAIDGRQGGI